MSAVLHFVVGCWQWGELRQLGQQAEACEKSDHRRKDPQQLRLPCFVRELLGPAERPVHDHQEADDRPRKGRYARRRGHDEQGEQV
ncbi:MAG TPA: hypothetical protein VLT82_01710 [Myxococcaceae bacterium]|nr:hypothetical protein [Myxococcaceae bacterium]